ncbi:MAG: SUMF1/EgtB/PvdO family nonheme iron enzyme, partial [Chitinispirillaceae bacterium]|nr:SUMF1/EgtB/PvdO family nonheme iron enzyme [Chitinispirillaceae bacterium]
LVAHTLYSPIHRLIDQKRPQWPVQSEKNYPVKVEIYTYRGAKLTGKTFSNLDIENGSLKIPSISAGFYIIKITINNHTESIRKFLGEEKSLIVKKGIVNDKKLNNTSASIESETDTLVVNANGYLIANKPISSFSSQNEEIVMTKSKQWIPSSPQELEKKGSMVKIKAKGCNFTMGERISIAKEVNNDDYNYECPAHTVSFTYDFWMDTTEVTQKQFVDVMKTAYKDYQNSWSDTYGRGDKIAAYMINMHDAMLYCNARSKLENLDTVYSYQKRKGDTATVKGKVVTLGDTLMGLVIDCSKNG